MPRAAAAPIALLDRREFLIGAGAAGMAAGTGIGLAYAQIAAKPDYSLCIARLRLDLGPGEVIEGTPRQDAIRIRRPWVDHTWPACCSTLRWERT
jgi:hypothetical protein